VLPHNVPFVLLGSGLLWFGWFGFNAGSALAASPTAALAFVNTLLAPAATLVAWFALDAVRGERSNAVGAATAIVVGLVAVTPAAGFIGPLSALGLGAVAAVPSYFAIRWRVRTRLDDSLDVVAAHGLGGLTGALLAGVLAQQAWGGVTGLLDGDVSRVGAQALAVLAAVAYSAAGTFVLLKGIGWVAALRADATAQRVGMDLALHAEEAYASGEGAVLVPVRSTSLAPREKPVTISVPAGAASGGRS
jgi:Amt family ammonium transporter